MSMKPNFNPSLTLRGGNTEVVAGGPLTWTDPGGRCTIEVTITQRLADGEVVARGRSGELVPPREVWDAVARVERPDTLLRPGAAEARGKVRVSRGRTPEPDEWTKTIELQ
jgi:hypothetical protein